MASACGHRHHPWPGRKGRLPSVRPQGGSPAAMAAAYKGLYWQERLPAGAAPTQGGKHCTPTRCHSRATVPAHADSVQRYRTRRGDGGGSAEGAIGFEVTLPKLLNMLRKVESTIKKEKPVLYIGPMLANVQAVGATPATSPQRGGAHKGVACRHGARPPQATMPTVRAVACVLDERHAALSPS
ncbi:hypothetical protein BHM03_00045415 [Ensete ventricosum]|nr:hypothetical protein BHM03_00045415 [Ensete ventricosum]